MIQTLGVQTLAVLLVLGIVLGPAATAVYFLSRRKRQALRERRSPLSVDLLRPPGHTLRQQLDEGRVDLGGELMVLMLLPALLLAFLYVASLVTGRANPIWMLILTVVGVAVFSAFQTRKLLSHAKQMEQWGLGLDAEMAAGQELDQLMRCGAAVFHDLAADKFNIDHVVVARQGVFAVETKGYRKPNRNGGTADATVIYDGKVLKFPEWSGRGPLAQADRQARWLSEWLTGVTGEKIEATPVVALPGWFVDRKGVGPVMVLSGGEIKNHLLKARNANPLTDAQVERVSRQVEQRCRDVKPFYRPIEEANSS
jgi:Nuclease-related domain